MANRTDHVLIKPDILTCQRHPPLSKDDLERYRRGLANLSPYHVRKLYNEVHDECRMEGERVPSPKAIQRLVQVWRQLWEWSRR